MAALITDPVVAEQLIAERRERGIDCYDEVWDGVYVMSPLANDEHQLLVNKLAYVLEHVIGANGRGEVRPGVNVSDREEDWQSNFRIPDVAVFLEGTAARNCDEFWLGGPDFAIEITSPYDKTYDKLPFYAQVGVRELLVVNRQSWQLELYRPVKGEMQLAQIAAPGGETISSAVVGLSFRLLLGASRPRIEVSSDGDPPQTWRM